MRPNNEELRQTYTKEGQFRNTSQRRPSTPRQEATLSMRVRWVYTLHDIRSSLVVLTSRPWIRMDEAWGQHNIHFAWTTFGLDTGILWAFRTGTVWLVESFSQEVTIILLLRGRTDHEDGPWMSVLNNCLTSWRLRPGKEQGWIRGWGGSSMQWWARRQELRTRHGERRQSASTNKDETWEIRQQGIRD